jgi:hypothetical protein
MDTIRTRTPTLEQCSEKRLCCFQIGRLEALGEPIVDRLKKGANLGRTVLIA